MCVAVFSVHAHMKDVCYVHIWTAHNTRPRLGLMLAVCVHPVAEISRGWRSLYVHLPLWHEVPGAGEGSPSQSDGQPGEPPPLARQSYWCSPVNQSKEGLGQISLFKVQLISLLWLRGEGVIFYPMSYELCKWGQKDRLSLSISCLFPPVVKNELSFFPIIFEIKY